MKKLFTALLTFCLLATASVIGAESTRLDKILADGVIKVGTTGDYKPLSFYNEKTAQYEGIEIDLAKSLAKSLGVKVEFVKTTWPTLLRDTIDNKFDIAMSGITRTYAREQKVFMSEGYITFGKTALLRKEDIKKYPTLEALNNPKVRVGVNPGGTNEKFVRQYLPNATITVHNKNAEIPGLVAQGTFDVMITDSLEAIRYSHENAKLGYMNNLFTKNQFGIMMPRDQVLLNYVNFWLQQQKLEGNIDSIEANHMK